MKPVRSGTKLQLILKSLSDGAKTNAEICEAVDEIGPYLSRTMAKLIARGLVTNLQPGKGRRAIYVLTAQQEPV